MKKIYIIICPKKIKTRQEINIKTYLRRIKIKKAEYGKNRYHKMSEKKQKLNVYQKNIEKQKILTIIMNSKK